MKTLSEEELDAIDRRIALEIMGDDLSPIHYEYHEFGDNYPDYTCLQCGLDQSEGEDQPCIEYPEAASYSTNIYFAWKVVEKVRLVVRPSLLKGWCAGKLKSVYFDKKIGIIDETYAEAETAPLAICLSALKAAELNLLD